MTDHDRPLKDLRAVAWPVYFAGALMLVLPLADLLASIWPVRIGQLEWRFGTAGLLAGFTLSPLLGLVMCTASAAVLGHRVMRRVIAVVAVAGAILLVAVAVVFTLDWLQYRAAAPLEARPGMDTGSLKAVTKHLLVAGAMLWLGVAGWRADRAGHGSGRARRPSAPLIREPAPPA